MSTGPTEAELREAAIERIRKRRKSNADWREFKHQRNNRALRERFVVSERDIRREMKRIVRRGGKA